MTETDQTKTTTTPETKKQGPAWKNSRLFNSFEEANTERTTLNTNSELETKIKRRSGGKFVVKTRKNKNVTTKTTN